MRQRQSMQASETLGEQLDALMGVLERHAHSEEEFESWRQHLPSDSASLQDRFAAWAALANEVIPAREASARLEVDLLVAAREAVAPPKTRGALETAIWRLAKVVERIDEHVAYLKRLEARNGRKSNDGP